MFRYQCTACRQYTPNLATHVCEPSAFALACAEIFKVGTETSIILARVAQEAKAAAGMQTSDARKRDVLS